MNFFLKNQNQFYSMFELRALTLPALNHNLLAGTQLFKTHHHSMFKGRALSCSLCIGNFLASAQFFKKTHYYSMFKNRSESCPNLGKLHG